ncbi:uncharacterized protein LOC116204391 [Punica granatum]|uniref:Ribbon-helix-helix protein CopG domain-containing protein n=2 Tax=Punica granatum TaxID=22663 RepID=A0A218X4I0_PUNGR|nr:uncharacterized protein LOC116204391 [Punica granatum]OWM79824.1 hypothetical protein CDL15_Pgr023236 [Punica granatum]PKI47461.1 hypothetical protein CRG98_032141 [Punica granatum]
MGNCVMSSSRVTAEEEIEKGPIREPSEVAKKEKKRVTFQEDDRVQDGHKDGRNEPIVRIRVVVTKEELKQLLSDSGRSEELLVRALRLRSISRSIVVSSGGTRDEWRPALESIPEDR